MRKFRAATIVFLGLWAGGSAEAVGGSAVDQAVTLTYPTGHWGEAPLADLLGADATGDQLLHSGWWYRLDGETREFPFPAPDSETYDNGRIVATWNNLDGKGFTVEESTFVFDGEGPSGGFVSSIKVRNDNAQSRHVFLFHLVDLSLAGTPLDDSGTLVTPRFLAFQDGGSRAAYKALGSALYQAGTGVALRGMLNDGVADDLAGAGLPVGPGDVAAAYEFAVFSLPPGVPLSVATVSLFVNPARDHVKGDSLGVLGQPPLWIQRANLANRGYQWMRRTAQLPLTTTVGSSTAWSAVVGVDDFDGDFRDEYVQRDTVTGDVFIGTSALTGAPTLPLNWKLSATGDFDADGKADILWRNVTSQKLVVWTMNGVEKTGAIVPSPDQAVDANWEVAAAADFNGDDHLDLLWYNQTSGRIVLWFMDGSVVRLTGQFVNPSSVGNNNWRTVAVGDFGKGPGGVHDTQDIVWQNDTSKKVVVWYMDLAGNRTSGSFITPDTLAGGWDVVGPR